MESRQQMTCVPSVTRRFFARVLDQIIFTFLWIPLFVQVVADFWHYGLNSLVRLDLRYFFLGLGLQFIVKVFCLKIWGATPGKLLLSLRLVSARGLEEPLTWAQSLLRVAADGFSFFFGLGLFSFALLRYDRTHLSDRMAETKVVRLCSHSQWLAQGAPSRHLFWGFVLIVYLSTSGFSSVRQLLHNSRLSGGSLVIEILGFHPH